MYGLWDITILRSYAEQNEQILFLKKYTNNTQAEYSTPSAVQVKICLHLQIKKKKTIWHTLPPPPYV